MPPTYEENRKNLAQLKGWYLENKGKRNEANTKFYLIDTLFLDCLGWDKQNISKEDVYEGKYTDYMFQTNRPVMILEAKKEGISFEMPEGHNRLIYSIKSLSKDNKEFKKAIEQVSDYCQKRGVKIGVVSNGWQMVVFIAARVDGISPLEGNAYVFPNLEFAVENFLTLWNLLSPHGTDKGNLVNKLIGDVQPSLPVKISATLPNYPGTKGRNSIQVDIQILSEVVLEDVIKEKEVEQSFLRECYCKDGALSQYSNISRNILSARYDNLFEQDDQKIKVRPISGKEGLDSDFIEIFHNSFKRRPILLIGDVGVGKTTFINNLIKVDAEDIFRNALTFKIDLGSEVVLTTDLRISIIERIIECLLLDYKKNIEEDDFVKSIYQSEITRFKNSIYKESFQNDPTKANEKLLEFLESKLKDRAGHLKKSLEYLSTNSKKKVIIFLDNCDQRDYESQQKAFLISQEFSAGWPVVVFVSLRPETFYKSIKEGALSGYHPKAFTISPPRIDKVIEKRLAFAQKITRGEIPLTTIRSTLVLPKLDQLLDILSYSLKNNPDLYRFVDNVCNGNVRQAIDIIKAFLGSGYVDTEKILRIDNENKSEGKRYIIPRHELMLSVIFGENNYFDPSRSPIANIFDVRFYDKKEHFLIPFLLGILNDQLNSGKDTGFMPANTLYLQLQGIGYTPEQVDSAVTYCLDKKLIETSARSKQVEFETAPPMIRITSIGVYHVSTLSTLFTYISAIIVDTPIFDDDYRKKIKVSDNIKIRLEMVEFFRIYLDSVWSEFGGIYAVFDWSLKSEELKKDILVIKGRVEQASAA